MTSSKRSRHGLHRLMVAVKTRDLRALDRRCAGSKALLQWKTDLISDLGGAENLCSQKRALVDAAVRGKLFIDSVDSWLLSQRSHVNARKKSILPALQQRQTLVDGLLRILTALGLERLEIDSGRLPAEWVEKVVPAADDEDEGAAEGETRPRCSP